MLRLTTSGKKFLRNRVNKSGTISVTELSALLLQQLTQEINGLLDNTKEFECLAGDRALGGVYTVRKLKPKRK
jgi:hypothetical protein